MNLSNNTILITGGAGGIGFEFAKQFIDLGNTVLITGRDMAKLEDVKKRLPKVHIFQSDVADPNAIEALYKKVIAAFPNLNIVVNNAGVMRAINLHDQNGGLTDITKEIEINLCGPIRMVKQFLPHLKKQATAAIVNVSSGLAFVPLPTTPVYCATKAGLHSYSLSLRVQLKNTSVKVFELAPPATKTELLSEFEPEDMKDVAVMPVTEMVNAAVKGMKNDVFEIRPGQSNQLKLMNRIAPQFILNQLSKPVDRMLATNKQ